LVVASSRSAAGHGGEPARARLSPGGAESAGSGGNAPEPPRIAYGLAAVALAAPVSKTFTDLALFATGLLFLWDSRAGRVRPRRTALDGAIALWAASQILATLVSLEPLESVRELRNLGYWALFYLAAWGVAAGVSLERLIALWLGAAAVAAVQGFAEVAFGLDLLHPPSPTASGFFTGHLPFGHVQAMAFALALGLLRESRARREQVIAAGLVVLFAAAVVASGGRGPWLALAVTALVLAFREAPRRIFLALAIVAAIQVAVVARQPGGLESFYRSYVVVDDEEASEVPEATVYSNLWRLSMWREGLRIFSLRPVLGTGVETAGSLSREFRTPFVDFGVGHLHSNYLEIAMTRGFVGLVALLAVGLAFASFWRSAIPALPRGPTRAIVVAALGAVLLHAVHGLTYYSLGSTPIQMSFLFVSGLAAGVVLREAPATEPPLRFRPDAALVAFVVVGVIAWLAPLLAALPWLALGAAALAASVTLWRVVCGRSSLFETSLLLAFLTLVGAAGILLAPLPNGVLLAVAVVAAAAASFALGSVGLRLVEAARLSLLHHGS
jgi:O-antigen ligase